METWHKRYRAKILNFLLGTFVVMATSFSTENTEAIEVFKNDIQCLEQQVQHLDSTIVCKDEIIQDLENKYSKLEDPAVLAEYVVNQVNLRRLANKTAEFPATKFLYAKNSVDGDISKELYTALVDYSMYPTSPDSILVTSAKRNWNFKSRHFHGDAIDLRADKNLQKFLDWIGTSDGNEWLKKNNLNFYVEDSWHSPFLYPWKESAIEDYVFVNKNATGPHVHLEYRG